MGVSAIASVGVGISAVALEVGVVAGASVGVSIGIATAGLGTVASTGVDVGIAAIGVGVSGAPTGSLLQAATAICKTTAMHKSAANADLRRATSLIL